MATEIHTLLELQRLDNEIILMEKRIEEIPVEIEDAREHVKKAEEELKNSEAKYDEHKKKIKLKEGEVEDFKEKMVKNRLKQNEVKTNEEYRALLKENEHIEKKIDALEEEIIIMLEDTENFKKEISDMKKILEEEKKKHQEIENEKNRELREIEKKIVECKDKRKKLADSVSEENYKQYEKLMKMRSNKAIAIIDMDGICTECSVLIPPQTVNEAIADEEIKFCPNCHRMLYYTENKDQ
ncbi:MAG: hypothetical protein D6734_02755 [Candidatus Schekmanbacteria bacterium]|nr:MAG: hypothetical protein D6734_02755 [Candidatus Schekmanbacteria bacterium]